MPIARKNTSWKSPVGGGRSKGGTPQSGGRVKDVTRAGVAETQVGGQNPAKSSKAGRNLRIKGKR